MKILLSAYSCEPNRGSEMELGWQAVEELASTAAEVVVVTKTNSQGAINQYLTSDESSTTRFHNIEFIYYRLPLWIRKWSGTFFGQQFNAYLWEIGLFFFLLKRYKKDAFDIAYKVTIGSYRFPSLIWYFAIRFIWGPFCSGEHLPLKFLRIFSLRGMSQEIIRLIIQRLALVDPLIILTLYKADHILTITQDTYQRLPAFARHKARVITYQHLTADRSAFDPVEEITLSQKRNLKLLYIGRLLEWKGIMLVLQALKQSNKRLDYEFTIIGDGPSKKYYEKYIQTHHLNVVFVPPRDLPRRKLSAYYLKHDLFIFPGLHGTGSYVMVEAQLHQRPVLRLDITAPASFKQEDRDIVIITQNKTLDQIVTDITHKLLLASSILPTRETIVLSADITPMADRTQEQISHDIESVPTASQPASNKQESVSDETL